MRKDDYEYSRYHSADNGSASSAPDMQQFMDSFCRAMHKIGEEERRHGEKKSIASKREPATINLVELFFRLIENMKWIVLAAVICALVGGIYAEKNVVPNYSATAKLYVLGQQDAVVNLSALQASSQLTLDYQEVFRTWEVHEMVRDSLNLNYSYGQMQSMLNVSNPEDTRVLYITVTNRDPQLATDIANAYAEAAQTFILETMDTDEPSTFSMALVPGAAYTKSKSSYVITGFLLGTILSIGVLILRFIFDDRPRSPEDITKFADIPTLAVIPAIEKEKKSERKSRQRGHAL